MTFVHLHTHSHFSPLDGAGKLAEMVDKAVKLGQPALALTDHGSMGGAMEFVRLCRDRGVKPIVGMEAYVAPQSRFEKKPIRWGTEEQKRSDVSKGAYTHLTLLARNAEGVRNLYRLHNLGWTEGYYHDPRIDKDLLAAHRGGLIVLSGCLGSELSVRLKLGHITEATELAASYQDIFGQHYYIEMMEHGIEEEQGISGDLEEIAHDLGIRVVPTNDSHYVNEHEDKVHDAVMCLQFFKKLTDPRYSSGTGYFLRSREEMRDAFGTEAYLDNTLLVAESVEDYGDLFAKKLRMPVAPNLPEGKVGDRTHGPTQEQHLRNICWGWLEDNGHGSLDDYDTRMEYELDTICSLGFAGYFLAEAAIINEGKDRGIVVGPGRGSAAGSLVAYALGITELDPLVFGLVFERFLNPQRASIPDIDIDIEDERHAEFRAIPVDLFGKEHVAAIGTYGTLGAKAALESAARVMGWPRSTADRLKGYLPPMKQGRAPKLEEIFDHYPGIVDENDGEIIELALGLEGLIRSSSIHAAGTIISPDPLTDLIPMRMVPKTQREKDADAWQHMVTAYQMDEVDGLGLVKFDFLGLRNLTNIKSTCEAIGLDYYSLPRTPDGCNDPKTYDLVAQGNTLGVFQLDGGGMQQLLRSLRPTSFGDISAVLALFRPGPMGTDSHNEYARRKNGKSPVVPIHPELDFDCLRDTYQLIVYQEQVMEILRVVCGWDYGQAELVFYALKKKDHAKLDAAKPAYVSAAEANGYSVDAIETLWQTLLPFADYSFNLAHTASYGLISYWTAWLKANHPTEYMSSLLGSVKDDPETLPKYLDECRRLGIPILPPDINDSAGGFTATTAGIRYGLSAIKGVGDAAFTALLRRRPYADLSDFFTRADPKVLNKGVLRALAKSGALDSLHPARHELVHDIERLGDLSESVRSGRGDSLFAVTFKPLPRGKKVQEEWAEWERDTLNTLVTRKSVGLVVPQPLDKSAWEYLHATLYGGSEVCYCLSYRGIPVADGVATLTETDRVTLTELGVEITDD